MSIPLEKTEIKIPNAKELFVEQQDGRISVRAVLAATHIISVNAHRQYVSPDEAAKKETPPKIYAEVFNLLSIEDDAIRVNSRFKLNVLQNKITSLKMIIPKGYNILSITGMNGRQLRDWQVEEQSLLVPFDQETKGNYTFHVISEKLMKDKTAEIIFDGYRIPDAVRCFLDSGI